MALAVLVTALYPNDHKDYQYRLVQFPQGRFVCNGCCQRLLLNGFLCNILREHSLIVSVLHRNAMYRAPTRLTHNIVELPPKTSILFMLDYGKDFFLMFVVVTFLCVFETWVQMLVAVLLTILVEVVTLLHTDLDSQEYLFNWD
jgi:hypothetical protein